MKITEVFKDKILNLKSMFKDLKEDKVDAATVEAKVDELAEEIKDENKFLTTTLEDGTDIEISGENVEVGATVAIIVDGESTPAPNGTHVLTDGTQIVTEDAVIIEVIPADGEPEAEEEPAEEEEAASDFNAEVSINELKAEVAKLTEALGLINNSDDFKNLDEKVDSFNKVVVESLELLAGEPDGQPTEKKRQIFAPSKKNLTAGTLASIVNVKK